MRTLQLKDSGLELRIEDEPFASGGEGGLYFIKKPFGYRKYVAKIYHPHKRKKEREEKIEYLVARPPSFEKDNEEIVVWPEEVLLENGVFVGFIMPLIKGEKLEVLCSAKLPRKLGAEWQHFARDKAGSLNERLQVCYRLAEAIHRVHETNNYVLVDLKPDNVMLKPNGHIALVDMDSVEVVENGKLLYSAPVATPEYTPPEYYRKEAIPGKTMVPESWDLFSLAAIFYKLLLGIHPYAASAKPPLDVLTTLEKKIEAGLFVHVNGKQQQFKVIPPPHRDFERLPADLRQLFVLCFEVGHQLVGIRPTALDWTLSLRGEKALALQRSVPSALYRAPVWDWANPPDVGFDFPKIDWTGKQMSLMTRHLRMANTLWLYPKWVNVISGYAMGLVGAMFLMARDFSGYHYLLFGQWHWALQALMLLLAGTVIVVFVLTRAPFHWQYAAYRLRIWRKRRGLKDSVARRAELKEYYSQLEYQEQLGQKFIQTEYQKLSAEWERLLATYREKLLELDAQFIRLLKEEREATARKVAAQLPQHPLLAGLPSQSAEKMQEAFRKRLQRQTHDIQARLEARAIYQRYKGNSLNAKKRYLRNNFSQKIASLAKLDLSTETAISDTIQQDWNEIQKERKAIEAAADQGIHKAFQAALQKRKKRFSPVGIRRFQRLSIAGQRRALKRRLKAEVRAFLKDSPEEVIDRKRDNLRRALGALTVRKASGFAPKPSGTAQIVQQIVQSLALAKDDDEVERLVAAIPEAQFSSLRVIMRKKVYEAIKDLEAQLNPDTRAFSGSGGVANLRPDIRRALLQVAPSRFFSSSTDDLAKRLEKRLNQLRTHYRQVRASILRHGKKAGAWHKRFETWFYPWYQRKVTQVNTEALKKIKRQEASCIAAYEQYLKEPEPKAKRMSKEKQALEAAYAERDSALDALAEERLAAEKALERWQMEREAFMQKLKTPFNERYDNLLAQGKKLKTGYKVRFDALKERSDQLPSLQRERMAENLGTSSEELLSDLNRNVEEIHQLNRRLFVLGPKSKPLSFEAYKSKFKSDVLLWL